MRNRGRGREEERMGGNENMRDRGKGEERCNEKKRNKGRRGEGMRI